MTRPVVSLLTDFGVRDVSASICRAVVLGICPDAQVIDLTHDVRKFSIRDGALALWCALPYLPVGFHVAVVDPGVGTARRPLAILTGRGDVLIGPDNGLLVPAAERLSGVVEAREIQNPAYRLPVVTSTFHGRDVFAPAAAHLARGASFESLGPAIDGPLVASPLPAARVADGAIETEVVYEDTFGNVKLSALAADVRDALGDPVGRTFAITVDGGRTLDLRWVRTFGDLDAGDPLLYEDSYGRACVGVNQGSAVASLGLRDGNRLELRLR
jgi:S-adenosylmethionine hydrolase